MKLDTVWQVKVEGLKTDSLPMRLEPENEKPVTDGMIAAHLVVGGNDTMAFDDVLELFNEGRFKPI